MNEGLKLNPVTQKVVEKCINEVLQEYVSESKLFTAETLQYVRSRITSLVHERLGSTEITNIDVGLDLNKVEDIKFFFQINVPQDKAEEHIIKQDK
jgi:cyanate lyase